MSSWYVFSSLGLYPLYPGRADLVLSSPVFSQTQIGNLTINAPHASDEKRFIKTLQVNGQESNKSWIDESYINQPTILNFELSTVPNKAWGSTLADRPPSYTSTSISEQTGSEK
jgi:putative alpha-1,2-mannosidase